MNATIYTLRDRLHSLMDERADLDITELVDPSHYDEFLDEVYPMVEIGGCQYYPSTVLEKVDPVAYRCGFSDWADDQDITETDKYQELTAQIAALEDEITDLEQEINELEIDD